MPNSLGEPTVRFDYAARIRVAIGLMIFFALLSNWRLLMGSAQLDLNFVGHDDITLYQKRFDGIRKRLPEHGIVGYAGGKLDTASYWLSDPSALRNWFLTQYALAPVVVSITPDHKLTIINADATNPEPSDYGGFTTQDLGNGYNLFDFGNGVKLVSGK